MFGDGSLTFREFAMRDPLPLATIHDAVLEFRKKTARQMGAGRRPWPEPISSGREAVFAGP
jgi:hypothetical protein